MNVFNFILWDGFDFPSEKADLQPYQYAGLNLNIPF
jgi:hypothetical protein